MLQAFLLLLLVLAPPTLCKLEMVVEVFRHGAREPTGAPYDSEAWAEYEGELTSAGLRQHFLLGREMRKRYVERAGFLSATFNHSEVYVRSTDVNRTIMSVQSHLLGLYPLGAGASFADDYPLNLAVPPYQAEYDIEDLGYNVLPGKYQPIPIHIVERKEDSILDPGDSCLNYKNMTKAQKATAEYQGFNEQFQAIFEVTRQVFNLSKPLDLSKLGSLTSDVHCDIFQNNPLPKDLSTDLLRNMTALKGLQVQYVDVGSEDERRLLGTPFLSLVQSYFQQKIAGSNPLKYAIFSAHDTTLQPFMAALNLTNWSCVLDEIQGNLHTLGNCVPGYPVFATQILFELHSNETDVGRVYTVKILHNGVEMKLCESENTECVFEEFSQRLSDFLWDDQEWAENCGNKGLSEEKSLRVLTSFLKRKY